jgi:hypothetical protein
MLKSWVHYHPNTQQQIVLIDNSTDNNTQNLLTQNNVPFSVSKNDTHGNGINSGLKLCKTKYALLVDTDILFLKNHADIFEQFKTLNLTLMGKIEGSRGGKDIYNRVNPWHCFINVDHIRKHDIVFFNEVRMKDSFKTTKIYDIGSTFFEDVKNAKLKIGDIDLNNSYFFHLEGMSWYKNKFDATKKDTGIDFGGTHNNPNFVTAYEQKINLFNNLKQKYSHTSITDKFIYE